MRYLKLLYWIFVFKFNQIFLHKHDDVFNIADLKAKRIIAYDRLKRASILSLKWFKYRKEYKIIKKKLKRLRLKYKSLKKRFDDFLKRVTLEIFFGVPGAGKTTFAVYMARKARKAGVPVYSNFPINLEGCYEIEPKRDLGRYLLEECLVIIDEAGLEHSNRDYAKFSHENRYFYKYHRHYKAKVIVFSQADDMDLTIRNVSYKMHLCKKSLLPFFIVIKPMIKYIDIDKNDHQPKAMYDWDFFIFTKRIFSPTLWRYFDTYDAKPLETKEFKEWKGNKKVL
jgi:DNA replication protein DnaC